MKLTNYLMSIRSKYGNAGVITHGIMVGASISFIAIGGLILYAWLT